MKLFDGWKTFLGKFACKILQNIDNIQKKLVDFESFNLENEMQFEGWNSSDFKIDFVELIEAYGSFDQANKNNNKRFYFFALYPIKRL